jgi:hypothetical protein
MIIREAAESLFASHCMERGFHVSFPAATPSYDIIVDVGGNLRKVQIKTSSRIRRGKYTFELRKQGRKGYQDECDVIVLHPTGTELFAILLPEDFVGRVQFCLDMKKHNYLINNYSRLCTPS